jgi:hypothetical protein
MERTSLGGFDLGAAIAKDFGCVSSRLAAQFVRIVSETANHMPQFVQEDSYLRGERISAIRTDFKAEPTRHL